MRRLSYDRQPRRGRALLVLLLLALLTPSALAGPHPPPTTRPAGRSFVYVPLVQQPDPFGLTPAIWPHTGIPAAHEVALFRYSFSLAEPLAEPQLAIFADTRYELWVDGAWVGRGPARFSRQTHEYDRYSLGTLAAGTHTIAALAQWAPNLRRSESIRPLLQARLAGSTPRGPTVAAQTGPAWRALISPAWRADAALVHAWGLIGPSELLDLRALPAGWMQPGFDDRAWPRGLPVPAPEARYQPRSIAALANVPMPASVRDSGLLAPGQRIAELLTTSPRAASATFKAQTATTVTIETLATAELASTRAIKLDNAALAWQPRAGRPDVVFATRALGAGNHTLTAANAAAPGVTLSITVANIDATELPFGQGPHAGRRLLLAAPASQPGAVTVAAGAGIGLTFNQVPAYAVVDLGRVVYGRVTATASGPAGAVLDIGWDERLWQNSRPLSFPGSLHPEWNETDSWVLDGGARTITTIDARGGRYLLIAAWGPGPIQLSNLRVLEERLPVQPRGSFSSADPLLNQIWQVGVNTLYPNMSDAYSDPWRERGQWWGDAYVIDHANEAAFGDTQLLGRGLGQLAEAFADGRPRAFAPNGEGNFMLDYGMLWAQSLRDYLRRTGDTQLPARLFPTLTSFLAYLSAYQNPATGLLDIPYGDWWETTLIDWAASTDRYGQSTAVNALYYRTLLDAADLAEAVGDPPRGGAWRQQAGQLKAAINANLYLPAQGAYLASIVNNVPRDPTAQAQAWALANDVVPPAEQQRVADALVAAISPDPATPTVEIYGMFWVLEGLGRAGRIADANTIIKRYYGYMLDRGATTWWELFNSNRFYTSSLSHGWGSAPTWFLTSYALGARRTGPHDWALRPALRAFTSMSGALPLGTGELRATWSTPSCNQHTLEFSAPPSTSGEVVVPFDDDATTLTLNNAIVWQNGRALAPLASAAPGGVRLSLSGGQYRLDIQHRCATQPAALP